MKKTTETSIEKFYPINRKQWRNWLQKNHTKKQSVWLIGYQLKSKKPSVSWTESVEEALCFGWIDSIRKKIDDEKFMQLFSKRKPNGTWSKINKLKVQQLINEGKMSEVGMEIIEAAKANGSWTILDEVEALVIFEDLEAAFEKKPGSKDFFIGLSKSMKKQLLQWIVLAKRADTRKKRIDEIVKSAKKKKLPAAFG